MTPQTFPHLTLELSEPSSASRQKRRYSKEILVPLPLATCVTVDPKILGFPPIAQRRKGWNPGASKKRILSPRKRFQTI